ncbi:hypothetical protein THASP1DRAFT_31829 [Thamnocephalis sphaerospora]|uniref:SET domain-containing protein n=1 Tax=Thamnocephalis sphaerospora TaxID=78915 RepID=A0A4P9XKL7_9FUNG|nr:hypothetical protein THASP1DRAFT_31829 [Thamnocephalis sphaerospora]|eukprot:RKP06347.1 hypothetical protein THASP1DRAFT_31829 [Thamnocephalis sphaerospora]
MPDATQSALAVATVPASTTTATTTSGADVTATGVDANGPSVPQHHAEDASTPAASAPALLQEPSTSAVIVLEDVDAEGCPTCLDDVVFVAPSTIPNAGRGLFAARALPSWTPIGFYFGVPMNEDEFDTLKDGVGLASHYSIMYRRTVLDATDDDGQPWTDPNALVNGGMYCPFHFMNEDVGRGNVAFIEGSDVNQVICMTTHPVREGEELFAYYGSEVDRHWASELARRGSLEVAVSSLKEHDATGTESTLTLNVDMLRQADAPLGSPTSGPASAAVSSSFASTVPAVETVAGDAAEVSTQMANAQESMFHCGAT